MNANPRIIGAMVEYVIARNRSVTLANRICLHEPITAMFVKTG
jgi:hypothetical protein